MKYIFLKHIYLWKRSRPCLRGTVKILNFFNLSFFIWSNIELLPPKISFTEKTLVVSQHNITNIILNCDVITGNPPPRVSWWFNNKEIKDTDRAISTTKKCDIHKRGFYRVTGIEDKLIICSLHYQFHAGRFECVASNKIGNDNGIINLVIKGKICSVI